jgi:hypothetical protein
LAGVFELTNIRYMEGAPMEWRHVLKPGVAVVLGFRDTGMEVRRDGHTITIPWENVRALSARGPDTPEQRWDDRLLLPWILPNLLLHLIRISRPYESYCWLAVVPVSGDELIFEVEQMLRPELERELEEHSG